jgi:hypothetical protein
MTKVLTEINFASPENEGLDWDTDPSLIGVGNSRYRLCCRSGRTGVVENFKGNTLCQIPGGLPPGENIVIGSCASPKEDFIIWCVYNSTGIDLILKYVLSTNTVHFVITDPGILNFDPEYRIYNARIVGNEFIYTTPNNEPRSFDINKAQAYTEGTGGDAYIVLDEQVISAIKYPSLKAPEVQYITDVDVTINNLRGSLWQFAYRWVYDDNGKSVASPVSKVPLPLADELADGSYFDNPQVNNAIDITFETGHYIVEKIEIIARDSNISDWVIVDVLDKEELSIPSFGSYTYRFYNNTARIFVDNSDVNRLFDQIPSRAKHQEVINGEYLLYANYLDGRDNIEVDTQMFMQVAMKDFNATSIVIPQQIFPGFPPDSAVFFQLPYPVTGVISANIFIKDSVTGVWPSWFNDTTGTSLYVAKYVIKPTDTKLDISNGIAAAINKKIDDVFGAVKTAALAITPLSGAISYSTLVDVPFMYTMFDRVSDLKRFYVTELILTNYNTIPKFKSWKQGSHVQFGYVYSDEQGRLGNVNTNDSMKLYAPYWSEVNVGGGPGGLFPRHYVAYFINHQPPEWAHKCHIVCTRNLSQLFHLQVMVPKASLKPNDPVGSSTNQHVIEINTTINTVADIVLNSVVSTYAYQPGDRLRIMYKLGSFSGSNYQVLPALLDVEIIGQDETTGDIYIPAIDLDTYNLTPGSFSYDAFLLEVYTPRKEVVEAEAYYEIAESIDITNPGTPARAHSPNNGIIDSGNTYVKLRVNTNGTLYPCESQLFSDYYESNDFDYGRSNVQNKDAKEKWLVGYYRVGGRKVLETKLNKMFTFKGEMFDSVGERYGEIVGVRQVGDTIKIYQENKLTSQYIFRTSFVDTRGQNTVQKSDNLFGTKMPSAYDYGCQDPGSIVVNDRYVYFLDAQKGVYCRDAANGIVPVSRYRMSKFWKEKCDILRKNRGKYYISSAYDSAYEELNVSVVSLADPETGEDYIESFTILFHEESNRWKTFLPYVPQHTDSLGDILVVFNQGDIYLQDTNDDRNNFFGVSYPMILDVFGNIHPKQVKIHDAIAVHSNKAFAAPDKGDIYVYPTESYPDGMESRLHANKFELLEGVYYASLLNDMNDPAFVDPVDALLNGRPLRGECVQIRLTNQDTTHVRLKFVTIKHTISEHSD